jgi:PAS domain S-box-containing protein
VVWAADGRGRFTEEQPSWQEYTGQTREQYRDLGWRKAFQETDQSAIDLAWARAVDTPSTFDLELCLWHQKSERHRFVSLRAVPVIESNGEIREWIGTVTDIDDQRRVEDEFRQLNAELEKRVLSRTAELEAANKELEGFSYSVSHDLRAPVRAIAGFSKILWQDQGSQLDEEGRRKLDIIRSEGARMGVLIDELLAFSRLGRQAIRMAELDMGQLARATYERLCAQHEGTKAEFRLGPLPHATADRVLLEQVWTNFLSNALKFTSKKEQPVIEVGAITDDKEHIYFIRDNGAGFDPRYQAKLFGVFQRLHDTTEFQGTGVGLALVHRIVTRHGGRVWAEGKPGEGATFYFTLPREQPDGSV